MRAFIKTNVWGNTYGYIGQRRVISFWNIGGDPTPQEWLAAAKAKLATWNRTHPNPTRADRVRAGLVWQLYPDSNPDKLLFEGTRNACLAELQTRGLMREYRRGTIRLGKLIWEPGLK